MKRKLFWRPKTQDPFHYFNCPLRNSAFMLQFTEMITHYNGADPYRRPRSAAALGRIYCTKGHLTIFPVASVRSSDLGAALLVPQRLTGMGLCGADNVDSNDAPSHEKCSCACNEESEHGQFGTHAEGIEPPVQCQVGDRPSGAIGPKYGLGEIPCHQTNNL